MEMLDMRKFYGIGSFLMAFAVIGSTWNLVLIWNAITIGARIANIASGVLFNALLFFLFLGLWKVTPSMSSVNKTFDSPELDALVKQYSSGEVTHNVSYVPKVKAFTRISNKGGLHN